MKQLRHFPLARTHATTHGYVPVEHERTLSACVHERPARERRVRKLSTERPEERQIIDPAWKPEAELIESAVTVEVAGQQLGCSTKLLHGPADLRSRDGSAAHRLRTSETSLVGVDHQASARDGKSTRTPLILKRGQPQRIQRSAQSSSALRFPERQARQIGKVFREFVKRSQLHQRNVGKGVGQNLLTHLGVVLTGQTDDVLLYNVNAFVRTFKVVDNVAPELVIQITTEVGETNGIRLGRA